MIRVESHDELADGPFTVGLAALLQCWSSPLQCPGLQLLQLPHRRGPPAAAQQLRRAGQQEGGLPAEVGPRCRLQQTWCAQAGPGAQRAAATARLLQAR